MAPVIARGYTGLEAEQARAFRLLSASANPFLSLAESAALLGRPLPRAEDLLEGLIDAGLLMTAGPAHYHVPVLSRLFARTLGAP
ncbi:hypothetical protein [Streptomyces sp. NPDC058955]|uniref:hypothetical protein n=1 Tax=unclassified Streptomyces TaxID=2593676 RepID=UPI00364B3FF3